MRLPFLGAALLLVLAGCGPGYRIADETVTLEVHPDTNRVEVLLELTYRVDAALKTEGFKFVGNSAVEDLLCTDGDGQPLESEVLYQKETKLLWRFPRQVRGDYTVKARFTLTGVLTQRGEVLRLEAPWIGVFQVPVDRARWRIQVPEAKFSHIAVVPFTPSPWRYNPGQTLIYDQEPVTRTGLAVLMGPAGAITAQLPPDIPSPPPPASGLSPGLLVLLVVGGALLIALAVWWSRQSPKTRRGLDGGTSSGGCAGASCGGGGGCGGGCGG